MEAVNHKVVIAKVSIGYDGIIAYIPAGIVKLDGFIGFYINACNGILYTQYHQIEYPLKP